MSRLRCEDGFHPLDIDYIFKTLYPICSVYTLAVYCNYAPGFWQKMWDSLTLLYGCVMMTPLAAMCLYLALHQMSLRCRRSCGCAAKPDDDDRETVFRKSFPDQAVTLIEEETRREHPSSAELRKKNRHNHYGIPAP